jgi:tetratricopeptide (TPR) repeat protein
VRELSGELGKRHDLVEATGIKRLESTRLSLYRFKHQLIQKYLYERLDEVELAWMHEDVGNILERLYQDQLDEVALQLARHFSVAGLNEKAARYLRLAGEQAARRFAHEEAIQHLTQALELTPARDARGRLQLLLEREAVYGWRGQREAQATDLDEMARLSRTLQEPGLEAEVRLRQADYARTTGAYESALALAQEAVTLAGEAGDGSREARAYGLWGRILLNKGDHAEAPEWLGLASELAQAAEDEAEVAESTYLLGLAHFYLHDYAQARDFMTQAQAAYRDMVSGKGEVNSLLFLGTLEIRFGNYGAAIDLLRRGLDVCRSIGWRKREAMILSSLGSTYVELGDYAAALHHHHQALLIAAEVGDRAGEAISLDTIGMVHQRRQESRQGLDFLQRALAIQREIGDRSGESYALSHLGFALADLGDTEEAAQAFQQAIAIRRQLGSDQSAVVDDLAGLAHVALIEDQAEQAQAYVDDILAWVEANGTQQVEYPVQVALICFQVLKKRASQDPRASAQAQAVLQQGYQLLQTQASTIVEEGLRRCLLYTSPSPRDRQKSRMPSSA